MTKKIKIGIETQRGCSKQTQSGSKICNHHSCNKLNVYNKLQYFPKNINTPDIVEVRFKNTRKAFFENVNKLKLQEGDMVAVEASPGHDIGIISLTGELVKEQMKRKSIAYDGDFKKVYRKVKPLDIQKWEEAINREDSVMLQARKITKELELDMKIGDVEFQGDGTKAIFYYIADERVDFRKLIRVLADRFKIRIEMRQIGARQEAGRIGGIGSCGRELCCSQWMSDFSSVTTDTAREQELTLNPQKLAGQCGKLKCCLNFEIDSYIDAKKDFPSRKPLILEEGTAYYQKTDVYKRLIWYTYTKKDSSKIVSLSVDRVKEIIKLNEKGKKPKSLEDSNGSSKEVLGFKNVVGEECITRFDNKKKKGKSGRKRRFKKKSTGSNNPKTSKKDKEK